MLGEKHASYFDFQDSDYYFRDSKNYPNISFTACFDEIFIRAIIITPLQIRCVFQQIKQLLEKLKIPFIILLAQMTGKRFFLAMKIKGSASLFLLMQLVILVDS